MLSDEVIDVMYDESTLVLYTQSHSTHTPDRHTHTHTHTKPVRSLQPFNKAVCCFLIIKLGKRDKHILGTRVVVDVLPSSFLPQSASAVSSAFLSPVLPTVVCSVFLF